MTTREIAEEIFWSADVHHFPWRRAVRCGYSVLYVNGWTRDLIARLAGDEDWRGLSLKPKEVRRLVCRLGKVRGLHRGGQTAATELAGVVLEMSRGGTVGLIIVEDGRDFRRRERVVTHECFHQIQYEHGLCRRSLARKLAGHAVTARAIPYLKDQYDIDDPVTVVSEIACCIAAQDHRSIGLSRREAADWFKVYRSHARLQ